MTDFRTIASLHAAYAAGVTPETLIARGYAALAAVNDPGMFIHLASQDEFRARAAELGPFDPLAKPLWGIPFAVKDNIDVAGMPTTAACKEFTYMPKKNAVAVQKLVDAGALPIGKTNLDQFATGLVGVRTPYPVPKNAIDPDYVPGGSSSGSAVVVARGLLPFALGTDTAGSGRVPAGLNNIVGLKPSLGSVSTTGLMPACRTLDTISVFAGTVADADLVFRTMAGFDPTDAFSRALPVPRQPSVLPPGLRMGVPNPAGRMFGGDALSEAAFDAALRDVERMLDGSALSAVDLDVMFAAAQLLYTGPWVAERFAATRGVIETRPEILHPVTRRIIESARTFSAADAFDGFYKLAALRRQAEEIWRNVDVLIVPTYPRPRTLADLAADPIGPNSELGTYTNGVNLLDLCALAVPSRRRADGFPSGVTLIAPRGGDGLLAAIGARLHAAGEGTIGATATPVPTAVDAPPVAGPGEIELVVVGAHLSGMPLNGELTRRGARFLRAIATTPDYQLFALPGGPPARPGLMRVAAGKGSAIATEVWALSPAALGEFLTGVPAPLGIGTTVLADGTTPKGFIVEAEGLIGATDVSSFGGWRAYVESLSPPP